MPRVIILKCEDQEQIDKIISDALFYGINYTEGDFVEFLDALQNCTCCTDKNIFYQECSRWKEK